MNNISLKNGFAMVPSDILKQKKLNGNQLAVYVAIIDFANKNNHAFPSYRAISEAAGVSRSTAIRAVEKLVTLGLINKTIRLGDYKNNKTNCYTVLFNGKERKNDNKNTKTGNVTLSNSTVEHKQYGNTSLCMSVTQENLVNVFEEELFRLSNAAKRKLISLLENESFEYLVSLIKYQGEINTVSWSGFLIAYEAFKKKGVATAEALRESVKSFRESCIKAKKSFKKVVKGALKSEPKKEKKSIDINAEMAALQDKYGKLEVEKAEAFVKSKKGIKNHLAYLKKALAEGWYNVVKDHKKIEKKKPLNFQNYDQRDVDYDAIEDELLGFEDECVAEKIVDEKAAIVSDSAVLDKYKRFLKVDNITGYDLEFLDKANYDNLKSVCIKFYVKNARVPSIDDIMQNLT